MSAPRQMALPLDFRPALARADFIVADCNRAAVAWIDRWPDWPGPALVVCGPAGAGKSHLAAVFQRKSGALAVAAGQAGAAAARLRERPAAIVDPLEAAAGEEAGLLHLFNRTGELGGHLLLVARTPPARLGLGLADLRSRLAALPVAVLGMPDDGLLAQLLAKHFADRRLAVEEVVIRYLVPRMERSFAAAQALAERLDRMALAERRPPSLALARRALE